MKHFLLLVALSVVSREASALDCGSGLKQDLIRRSSIDLAARTAVIASPKSKDALNSALRVDAENTAFMRQVLAQCGWPKKSVVGPEAAKAAWKLTQHADESPEFQIQAARLLKGAVLEKEADAGEFAALVDRNRRLNDLPQVYGMQFFLSTDDTIEFYSIVNPAQLDDRRKEVGLPSFYCWATSISESNNGAAIRWPAGILFHPEKCADAP